MSSVYNVITTYLLVANKQTVLQPYKLKLLLSIFISVPHNPSHYIFILTFKRPLYFYILQGRQLIIVFKPKPMARSHYIRTQSFEDEVL